MKSARPDYYQALGVERGADAGEIKAAYRRLAFAYHPDRNPGDADAEEKFKEVSVAYAVLGDEDKREKYGRFGSLAGDLPLGTDADLRTVLDFFDAVFGDLFGTARKRPAGQDLRYTLELSFAELALGCEKEITFTRSGDCPRCRGTGAEGGAAGLLAGLRCAGQGTLKQKAGLFTARRECPACNGVGQVARESCPACAGAGLTDVERRFTVRIPSGSQQGKSQRVPGEGAPSRPGGIAGDLHVIVRVQPDPIYRQEGDIFDLRAPPVSARARPRRRGRYSPARRLRAHEDSEPAPSPAAYSGYAVRACSCRAGAAMPTCGYDSRCLARFRPRPPPF